MKSDMKPQKVTIGVVSLPSKFRHYVVPSKETSAYIQVRLTQLEHHTLSGHFNHSWSVESGRPRLETCPGSHGGVCAA